MKYHLVLTVATASVLRCTAFAGTMGLYEFAYWGKSELNLAVDPTLTPNSS